MVYWPNVERTAFRYVVVKHEFVCLPQDHGPGSRISSNEGRKSSLRYHLMCHDPAIETMQIMLRADDKACNGNLW
jgi:hypothetical protein